MSYHVNHILSLTAMMSPEEVQEVITALQNKDAGLSLVEIAELKRCSTKALPGEIGAGAIINGIRYPNYIPVIKAVRARTGCDLRATKELVDTYLRKQE